MSNNYTPPNAELKDDTPGKGIIAHILFAAASGFLTIFVIVIFTASLHSGRYDDFNFVRAFLLSVVFAVISGAAVFPFRTIPWYLAVAAGIVVSFFSAFLAAAIFTQTR